MFNVIQAFSLVSLLEYVQFIADRYSNIFLFQVYAKRLHLSAGQRLENRLWFYMLACCASFVRVLFSSHLFCWRRKAMTQTNVF